MSPTFTTEPPTSRLVPAEEVGKAWVEGHKAGVLQALTIGTERDHETNTEHWLKSRAKRVMEGEV